VFLLSVTFSILECKEIWWWTDEGLHRFNFLHEEAKADRLKHGETVNQTFKQTVSHPCLPKKGPHINVRDISVVDDFTE